MIQHADRLTLAQGMLLDHLDSLGAEVSIKPIDDECVSISVRGAPDSELELLRSYGFDCRLDTWYWTNGPIPYGLTGPFVLTGTSAQMPLPGNVPAGTFYFDTSDGRVMVAVSGQWTEASSIHP